jgi:hypothetical protein
VVNELRSIDVLSSTDAWAVGLYSSGSYDEIPLVEHWNGATWAIVDIPAPWPAYLNDVVAISADDVWAVGTFEPPDDVSFPLTEHWDGTAWTIVGAPLGDGSGGTVLTGVSAASSSDVWAVGYTYTWDTFYPQDAVIEHWDGAAWSLVDSSTQGSTTLIDVDVVDRDDAWAIGSSDDIGSLGLHWNGASWSVSRVPQDIHMSDLAATGPGTVWVAGWHEDDRGARRAAAVVHTPDGWRPTPDGKEKESQLSGIDAISPSHLWAVGYHGNGIHPNQTLIEEFVSCQASPHRP